MTSMYSIMKRFTFDASHRLLGLDPGHKCARLHGHTYSVDVVVKCKELDARGFAQVDYGDMKEFKQYIDANFDHRTILRRDDPLTAGVDPTSLSVVDFNPTAELLARLLFDVAQRLVSPHIASVRVSETPSTYAEYRPTEIS